MASTITDSRLASVAAKQVYQAFKGDKAESRTITGRARERFERRDWQGPADAAERLALYRSALDSLVKQVEQLLGTRADGRQLWVGLKAMYSTLIARRDDWEIAETFLNSLTRRRFTTVGVDQQVEFVHTDFEAPPTHAQARIIHTYGATSTPIFPYPPDRRLHR